MHRCDPETVSRRPQVAAVENRVVREQTDLVFKSLFSFNARYNACSFNGETNFHRNILSS